MDTDDTLPAPLHVHAPMIKNALPAWLIDASPGMRALYAASALRRRASELAAAQVLGQFKTPVAFAKPLLEAEIERVHGLVIDAEDYVLVRLVNQSSVPLSSQYWPAQEPLLQAAMRNFEPAEAVAGGLGQAFIMKPEGIAYHTIEAGPMAGHAGFSLDRETMLPLSAEQFARLCRDLDLGKLYLEHFHQVFQPLSSRAPARDQAQADIAMALVFQEQDTLENLAHIALLRQQISSDAHTMLLAAARGHHEVAQWHGQPVRYQTLELLATPLRSGTLLRRAMLFERGDGQPGCVAYLPSDHSEPLKEYPSVDAFSAALREKLRAPEYRRQFETGVSIDQRSAFTTRLVKTLSPQRGGTFSDPYHQPDPQADIGLRQQTLALPWSRVRYEQHLQWIAYEARLMVVPTADQNERQARERIAEALGVALSVLNLASFVVPAIGVLAAGLGAIQLLEEVFVGIDDWRHGQTEEALTHLISVAENVALIAATVAAGAVIARSPWVDGMVQVSDGHGRARLWDRSLVAYRSPVRLPAQLRPNGAGQYLFEARTYVRLDGYLYEQRWDSVGEQWKIVHPQQPEAFQPPLRHNGAGAWRHIHEQPETWSEAQLMRRLGTPSEGLDDAQLARARQASGISLEDLAELHDTLSAPPAGLADSLARLRAENEVQAFIGCLRDAKPVRPHPLHAPALLVEMPGWPRDVVIELPADQPGGEALIYGARENPQAERLRLTRQELTEGAMIRCLLERMSETRRLQWVGESVGVAPTARAEALSARLAEYAYTRRGELLENFQRGSPQAASAPAQPLLRQFPRLTPSLAEAIAANARGAEQDILAQQRVPLRLAEQAHHYQRELRLNRALLGTQGYGPVTLDGQRLLLGALERLPGWGADTRIELRQGSLGGTVLGQVGADSAPTRRTIVADRDRWQAFDADGLELRGGNSLGEAIVAALPDAQRDRLGYGIDAGDRLQAALAERALADRAGAARWLGQASAEPWFRAPTLQADGRFGYALSGRGWARWMRLGRDSVNGRLRRLYPALDDNQLRSLREGMLGEAAGILTRLETEYTVLTRSLQTWAESPDATLTPQQARHRLEARRQAARLLEAAWRREGPAAWAPGLARPGVALKLNGLRLGELPTLVADFSHVHALDLGDMNLGEQSLATFLPAFEELSNLDLSGNQLVAVPPELARMPRLNRLTLKSNRLQWQAGLFEPLRQLPLTHLSLSHNGLALSGEGIRELARIKTLQHLSLRSAQLALDSADIRQLATLPLRDLDLSLNQISLDADGAQAFADMTALRHLRLSHNPLGQSPQVHRMHRLQWLEMHDTQLTEWPAGLTALMQRQPLVLESVHLLNNPIREVPALRDTPYGQMARRAAYRAVVISDEPLSEASREHLREINSDALVEPTDTPWMAGASDELNRRYRQLQEDPGSANFLVALDRSVLTADYRADPARQQRLLWELLADLTPNPPAPGIDDLRAQLYQLADDAEGTCGDGLQLVFNHARNLVQVYKVLLTADVSQPATLMPAVVFSKRLFRQALVDDQAMLLSRRRSARRARIYPNAAAADAAGGAHRPVLTTDPAVLADHNAALAPLDGITDAELEDAPDEAEIRLKLRLLLADRLELPNVPRDMLYVTPLDEATAHRIGTQVLAETTTPSMLDWLVQQTYWRFLLERKDPAALAALEATWNQGYSAVYELSRTEPEAVEVPAEVHAVLKQALPEKAWDSTDLARDVRLDGFQAATAGGALDDARETARTALYKQLSEPMVKALLLEQSSE
jgi:hypothetical protein